MTRLPFEFALFGGEIALVLLGLVLAVIMPIADRWNRRFFICFFSILVLYGGFCALDEVLQALPDPVAALQVVYFFETLLCMILMLMLTIFLHHSSGEDWRKSPFFRAVAALWTLTMISVALSPFTNVFYEIGPDRRFVRGPLYPLTLVMLAAIQILNLVYAFRWRSRMSRMYFYALIIGMAPMTLAILIHFFVTAFTLLGLSMTICALAMLGIILFAQIDQTVRMQREIAHQRASIMVLQMRPHFIYNTMMSIYYLCKQDPDLAQQVTLDFTTYLRRNFTAIASEELIPFSEELEHTRAYLAVEQAQFDDRLFVEYDTPRTDFRVPPLTLQPIVENAVKHGMDPDAEPLHILIRTAGTNAGFEITVENTGADFGAADDGGTHTALENIRQRLEMMCRGSMRISPRKGGGTSVRVLIPRERGKRAGQG